MPGCAGSGAATRSRSYEASRAPRSAMRPPSSPWWIASLAPMREIGSGKTFGVSFEDRNLHFVAAVADSYEDLVRAWFKQVDGSPGRLVSVRSVEDDSMLRIGVDHALRSAEERARGLSVGTHSDREALRRSFPTSGSSSWRRTRQADPMSVAAPRRDQDHVHQPARRTAGCGVARTIYRRTSGRLPQDSDGRHHPAGHLSRRPMGLLHPLLDPGDQRLPCSRVVAHAAVSARVCCSDQWRPTTGPGAERSVGTSGAGVAGVCFCAVLAVSYPPLARPHRNAGPCRARPGGRPRECHRRLR